MALEQNKSVQTVWAILLMAMGLLLFIKTPYAVQQSPQSPLLNFARYFIAAILTLGGAKKLVLLFFFKPRDDSHAQ